MATAGQLTLLTPAAIGPLTIRNRFVRSATCETMASSAGVVKPREFSRLYLDLAAGGVGLLFSGHCYVHPRGQATPGMTGLNGNENIPTFRELSRAVRDAGAHMFLELNHAGSQSRMLALTPLAPSAVPNPQTGRLPEAATDDDIREIIDCFGTAAGRVREGGFDGVHVHAGHGYLLSEFLSPFTNRRSDDWGGPLEYRQRLLMEVVGRIRQVVGTDFPLSVKLGIRDFVPGGLDVEEGLATARALEGAGVDAIEVSAGLTSPRVESSIQYAGVSRRRALRDKMVHRLLAKEVPGAYFAEDARQVRQVVGCPLILVGGLRRIEAMESVVRDRIADFVSLARPFIREPDLVRKVEAGRRGEVDCVSCNICAMHAGLHPLKCWRDSNRDLVRHAWYRMTGRLRPPEALRPPKYS